MPKPRLLILAAMGLVPRWLAVLLLLLQAGTGVVRAFENEVYLSGGTYRWKINNVEQGSTADLATAMTNCIWQSAGSGRQIHLLTGGSLASTIGIPPNVSVYGHGNTFSVTHGNYAVHARNVDNIGFYDMTIIGSSYMVFRISSCDNVVLSGIHIDGGFIGVRAESSDSSSPWNFRAYNFSATNCTFENLGSHGLETYGITGSYVDGIVARNNGECGVLFNNSSDGYVGTVDAYRCSYGGGYAGLRFANGNSNFRVKYLKAIECGRGFFTTTDARNIVVEEVYIRGCSSHAILLQNSDEVGINSGTHDGFVVNHYTSVNCWNHATDATGVTDPLPPAPASLAASPDSNNVSLSWPAVSGATSYRLQRSTTSSGPFFTIAYTEATEYLDRAIPGGTNHYYRVRAVNAAGPGEPSAAIAAVISGPVTPVVDLETGLKIHYPFNGSAVDSKGGPTPSISGGASYATGMIGQALSFNGTTNFASLPTLSGSNFREFTAATWIWRGSNSGWRRIFDFGNGTSNYMMLTQLDGTLIFDITRNGLTQCVQTAAPTMGLWAHVAVTFTGNWATLYINGELKKSVLFSNNPVHLSLANNYLAKSQWPDPLFQGRIDDLRLYTRSLSSAEITALVMAARPLAPTALIAGGFGMRVNLNWSGALSATYYNVKRSTASGGPYTTIASGLTATSFVDTAVISGSRYFYVVSASNANGESDPSNEETAAISDLVIHLKFDETSGNAATDSSGNGWNARLVNGPTFASGKLGNSLELPNSSAEHATLPTGVVSGLDDFTISLWAKVNSFATWARIFDFGTGTNNYMFLTPQYTGTAPNAAKLRFAITTPTVAEQSITSSTAVSAGTWFHVAITCSGNTGRMYLNGNLVGTASNMTLRPSSLGLTNQNYLGRSQWPDPYFNGSLDDLRIYSKALTQQELTEVAVPIPEAPISLTAIPDDGKVTLSWPIGNMATSYIVKRATSLGGQFTIVASDVTGASFVDSLVSNGTTYHYIVTSANSRGESPSSSPEASATPSNLRVHLKFDEDSGSTASDSSGRGAHASLWNSPSNEVGKFANSLRFTQSSSQYATLPQGVVSDLTTATLMCWVKTSSVASWQRIFDFGTGTSNYMFLTTQYATGGNANRLRFAITNSGNGNEQRINSSIATPSGTWVHVAVVLNGGTGTLYLNGSPVGQNTTMTLNPSNLGITTQNFIGRSQFPDPYLDSSIDDFRIYNRAMPSGEIADYATPLMPPQNLVAVGQPDSIHLSWTPVATGTTYSVKVGSLPGGPYEPLVSGLVSPEYLHTGLGSGTTRFYVASASNPIYSSADSVEISATSETPPIVGSELVLSFRRDSASAGSLTFEQSVIGHHYQLQVSPDLSNGTWTNVGPAYQGNGEQLLIPLILNPATRREFYRIKVTR